MTNNSSIQACFVKHMAHSSGNYIRRQHQKTSLIKTSRLLIFGLHWTPFIISLSFKWNHPWNTIMWHAIIRTFWIDFLKKGLQYECCTFTLDYRPSFIIKTPLFYYASGSSRNKNASFVFFSSGRVIVDEFEQTNVQNIFAIGDILDGKLQLTPVAIQAGKLLARRLFAGAKEKVSESAPGFFVIYASWYRPLYQWQTLHRLLGRWAKHQLSRQYWNRQSVYMAWYNKIYC